MNWKKRQMFGGRPSGIVQMMGGGMTPYPTHVMPDGSVMRGAVHGQGYQDGGVLPELFEEGDSDINNALNNMASVSNPEVPDMPASAPTNDGLMIEKTMTMDQGSGYENDVMRLKEDFKNEIRSYASQSGKEGLGKYLKNMDMTYSNALKALKKNYEVETVSPSESLLNQEFLEEIILIAEQGEIPKMQGGGLIESIVTQEDLTQHGIKLPLELWLTLPDSAKQQQLLNAYAKKEFEGEIGADTYSADLQKLIGQGEALIPEIGLAAGSAYKTKEGGTGGFIGQLMAAKAGETAAKQQLISDQINALSGNRSRTGSGKYENSAAIRNAMAGIEGKPDISIFKAELARVEDELPGFGLVTVAGQRAEYDGLPPNLPQFQIFRQTVKGTTWPQFYRQMKAKFLKKQENTELTPEFYKDTVERWRQSVSGKSAS